MNILSIGGSDPSSGAGIQSDIRVFSTLDAYCFTVITGITSQNTSRFDGVEPVSEKMIKSQLESIFSDFSINAIKIGMVYNSNIIKVIHDKLKKLTIPIIVDPVISSTTRGTLLKSDSLDDYKKLIIPLATVITPNVSEAEKLSGINIKSKKEFLKAATLIAKSGAKTVIITGYKTKEKISDFVFEKNKNYFISGKQIHRENHGSGCNYSAALCYCLAKNMKLSESVKFAKQFTFNSIKNSKKIGHGISITQYKKDPLEKELNEAINEFTSIKDAFSVIPECQTNFVFSKNSSKSINDILGITGRIVKSGKDVVVAGNLGYGGSKHVATAVMQVSKKFPQIRSALNIRNDEKFLQKAKKNKFTILSYDRSKEPQSLKLKKNSSISWGINYAIKDSRSAPDIIYHKGDFGKEAMILIFGKNPKDVIKKLHAII